MAILEGDAGVLLHVLFGRALADTAHEAAASGPPEDESHQHPDDDQRQNIGQQEGDHHPGAVRDVAIDRDARLEQPVCEGSPILRDGCVPHGTRSLQIDLQPVGLDVYLVHLVLLDHLHKLIVADLCLRIAAVVHHIADDHQRDDRRQQHDHKVLPVGPLAAASLVIIASSAPAVAVRAPAVVVALDIVIILIIFVKKVSEHSDSHAF